MLMRLSGLQSFSCNKLLMKGKTYVNFWFTLFFLISLVFLGLWFTPLQKSWDAKRNNLTYQGWIIYDLKTPAEIQHHFLFSKNQSFQATCFKGVTRCLMRVLKVCQQWSKGLPSVLKGPLRVFKGGFIDVWGCLKVTRLVFQWRFREVSMMFQHFVQRGKRFLQGKFEGFQGCQ